MKTLFKVYIIIKYTYQDWEKATNTKTNNESFDPCGPTQTWSIRDLYKNKKYAKHYFKKYMY